MRTFMLTLLMLATAVPAIAQHSDRTPSRVQLGGNVAARQAFDNQKAVQQLQQQVESLQNQMNTVDKILRQMIGCNQKGLYFNGSNCVEWPAE